MKTANSERRRLQPRLARLQARIGASLLLLSLCGAAKLSAEPLVQTLSGGWWQSNTASFSGNQNGNTYEIAQFNDPSGLTLDLSGTRMFVADHGNNEVRLISNVGDEATSYTSTFLGASSGISGPVAVAMDGAGNLYVLNQGSGKVLEFDGVWGLRITNSLVNRATNLVNATAIALDGLTNIYVTCRGADVVQITPTGVKTFVITNASLRGVAVLGNGRLALTDAAKNGVWILDPVSGVATPFTGFHGAGDVLGPSSISAFDNPQFIAAAGGNALVVADQGNQKVKIIDGAGTVTRLYGVNPTYWVTGPGTFPGWWDGSVDPVEEPGSVEARQPLGVTVGPDGSVYTTETYYDIIRHATGTGLSGPSGPGGLQPGYFPQFGEPMGIALDNGSANLYVADLTNNAVEVLNFGNNLTEIFLTSSDGLSRPVAVAIDSTNDIYVLNQGTNGNGYILEFDPFGNLLTTNATGLVMPTALALDAYANIFVAEAGGAVKVFGTGYSNSVIAIINANTNVQLEGIGIFDDGTIAVSDAGNQVMWQINAITKKVGLLTGQMRIPGATLGSARFAKLNQPHQLTRAGNNQLVAADYGNNRVVAVARDGSITNVLSSTNAVVWFGESGDPVHANSTNYVQMALPVGVAVAANGATVYASEVLYNDIRGIPVNVPPPSAPPFDVLPFFNGPAGIALDASNAVLYIADFANNAVEALDFSDNSTTTFLGADDGLNRPMAVAVDASDNLYVLNQGTGANGTILEFDSFGNLEATNATGLVLPAALTLDGYGNLFVAEQGGAVKVFGSGYSNSVIATISANANVRLEGIAIFDDGAIAVSDAGNHVIWQINAITKTIRLLTGQLGIHGTTLGASNFAKLYQPQQLARVANNELVAADYGNNRLVVVQRSGSIATVLNSTNAEVWFGRPGDPVGSNNVRFVPMVSPVGLAVSSGTGGGVVYASEAGYDDIRGLHGSGLTPPPSLPFDVLPFFSGPMGIALDLAGANLYIADQTNNAVEALNLSGSLVTTFLNGGNGLSQPVAVAVDATNNILVLNQGSGANGSILRFDQFGNHLGTVATALALPTALALDGNGNVFVAEQGGAVKVFGVGYSNSLIAIINTNASVRLEGIAIFDDGAIAVSDAGNHVIWQISAITNALSLLTGQWGSPGSTLGSPAFAQLHGPRQLTRAANNQLVVADFGNNRLVTVARNGSITNVLNSGNAEVWFGRPGDPVATNNVRFVPMVWPVGVAVGNAGTVYASEVAYNDIRGLLGTGVSQPPAPPVNILPAPPVPPGPPAPPFFNGPMGIALDAAGANLYIADQTNNAVQALNLTSNLVTTFLYASNGLSQPVAVAVDATNNILVLNQGSGANGSILRFDRFGNHLGTSATGLVLPTALTLDGYGNLFVAEQGGAVKVFGAGYSNSVIATINTNAKVQLEGIAIFDDGTIAVSDAGNQVIWQINAITKTVSQLSGQWDSPGSTLGSSAFAQLNGPRQLSRAASNQLVVADFGNNRLVTVARDGSITNVLNSGNAKIWFGLPGDPVAAGNARFLPMVSPVGVAVSSDGAVYASEVVYDDIRGLQGTGLTPPPSLPFDVLPFFSGPMGIAVDVGDVNLYIADQTNNAVQALNLASNLVTTFLNADSGLNQPVAVAVDATNNILVLNQGSGTNGSILRFDRFGNHLGTNATGLVLPTAFTMDGYGNLLVAEQGGAVKVFGAGFTNSVIVTVNTNASVRLEGIALFDDGAIAVSDAGNHVIWQINAFSRAVTQLSGQFDSPGATLGSSEFAQLNGPRQLVRAATNQLVVADYGNNRLVTVARDGSITNVLNSGNAEIWFGRPGDPVGTNNVRFVPMVSPVGVAVGSAGTVYASEVAYDDIRGLLGTGMAQAPPLAVGVGTNAPVVPVPVLPFFNGPMGIALDAPQANLYIADQTNNAVQALNLANNLVTTFLYGSNGLSQPVSVIVDATNNILVLNQGSGANGSILRFDRFGNHLGTVATGLALPTALTLDGYGNLFVTEQGGAVKVFGTGYSNSVVATINTNASVQLEGIAIFDDGTIAVSDAGNHVIWQINAITRTVSPLSGQWDSPGSTLGSSAFAQLNGPRQLARTANNQLVAADFGNNRLVTVARDGSITNVLNSGNAQIWFGRPGDPVGTNNARFVPMVAPVGVAVSSDGTVYASEVANDDIRGLQGTRLTPPASLPFDVLPFFSGPIGVAMDIFSSQLFIADFSNNAVESLNLGYNQTVTFLDAADGLNRPVAVAVDASDNLYVLNQGTGLNGTILEFDIYGNLEATNATGLVLPTALTLDGYGNLFVAEQGGAVKVFGSGYSNSVIATISTNPNVQLEGIAIFDDGAIAVSDAGNHVIWQINAITKTIRVLTGQLGQHGTTLGASNFAKLYQPQQLSRAVSNQLVVADYGNNRLVLVQRSGLITTALNSTNAQVWFGRPGDPVGTNNARFVPMISPVGVVVGNNGTVYATEAAYNDVRGLLGSGLTPPPSTPLAGLPVLPFFSGPMGVALDVSNSQLFIADFTNNAVESLNLGDNQTATFLDAADGLNRPVAVAVDASDNLYVLNQGTGLNGTILEFDLFGNLEATNATGLALPTALTLDGYGNLFVAEQGGAVKVFGSGYSNSVIATINTNPSVQLEGIAIFDDGAIAVSDAGNHVIWQINAITKTIGVLTGHLGQHGTTLGASNFAKLYQPQQLSRAANNQLVAADYGNNRLVLVQRSGSITTALNSTNAEVWFGRPGDPVGTNSARFVPMISPVGVVVGNNGTVYATEAAYNDVRGLLGSGLTPPPSAPLAGLPVMPFFSGPMGVALDISNSQLFIADFTNNAVEYLNLGSNQTTNFLNAADGLNRPVAVAVDASDNLYVLNQGTGLNGSILEFDMFGNLEATNATGLVLPTALAFDGYGNLFVAEQGGAVKVFGTGYSNSVIATINTNPNVQLEGIAIFDDGAIAVSDAGNHVVWQINAITKTIRVLTGQLGQHGATLGASNFAKLYQPQQLSRAANNQLVAADYGNNRLVLVQRSGSITTVLNSTNAQVWFGRPGDPVGTNSARFVPMISPVGVAVGNNGIVYATEEAYNDVRGLLGSGLTPPPSLPFDVLPFFSGPMGIALDVGGVNLYIADQTNNAVEALNLSSNLVTTFLYASNGLSQPVAVAVDASDNILVLNQGSGANGSILKFDRFANRLGTSATGLVLPTALTLDGYGNLFVAEQGGAVKVFGTGYSNSVIATINTNAKVQLEGIAIFDDGTIAVSDAGNQVIWQINAITKTVSQLSGQWDSPGSTLGPPAFAQLNGPRQLSRAATNQLVVADYGNNRLVTVARDGSITNVLNSGNAEIWFGRPGDPVGTNNVRFVPMVSPVGVAVASGGTVYASEAAYNDVRGLQGSGLTPPASLPFDVLPFFNGPMGVALDVSNSQLFIADFTNNAVESLNLGSNQTTNFLDSADGLNRPVAVAVDALDNLYVLNRGTGANGTILEFDLFGNLEATNATGLALPTALTLDGYGNLFVAEQGGAVKVFGAGYSNSVIATINTNPSVQLEGIAIFDDGAIAVSDAGNHVIWQINAITKTIRVLTGQLGQHGATLGASNFARLYQPQQLSRAANNQLVAADYGNNRLVLVQRSGSITTVLNSTNAEVWFGRPGDPVGTNSAEFVPMISPVGVVVGNNGAVYATEAAYNDVRGLLGSGLTPPPSLPFDVLPFFNGPMGIAVDNGSTRLYIADQTNNAVKALDLVSNLTTTFLSPGNYLNRPVAVAVDATNNILVLNQGSGLDGSVMRFDRFGNLLQTNATGLVLPTALTLDGYGNLFVAEMGGAVKAFGAGNSNSIIATVHANANVQLQGIAIFDDGAVAVSDAGNHVIWQINAITKTVSLLAGELGLPGATLGSPAFARLNAPRQLARAGNNQLIAADFGNNRLAMVSRDGSITNILNSDNAQVWFGRPGDPVANNNTRYVSMVSPVGVALGGNGTVYASEAAYNDIRGLLSTGLTPPAALPFDVLPFFKGLKGIALDTSGGFLFVADAINDAVEVLDLSDNVTTTYLDATDGLDRPVAVAVDVSDNLYVLSQGSGGPGFVTEYDRFGNLLNDLPGLNQPTALIVDGAGNVFVAEVGGTVHVFGSGGSSYTLAAVSQPGVQLAGIAILNDGDIAVSDAHNQVIWQINPISKMVRRLTGQLGLAGSSLGSSNFARLNQPMQLTLVAGNQLIAADYGNNRLVVVARDGSITNVLNSTNALVWYGLPGDPVGTNSLRFVPMALPVGVAASSIGTVYASEAAYGDIRGLLGTGFAQAPAPPFAALPLFNGPMGIALDNAAANLFIADQTNNAVEALNLGGNLLSQFLNPTNGINQPVDVAVDGANNVYVLNQGTGTNGTLLEFDAFGNPLGAVVTNLHLPTALMLDNAGNFFVTELAGTVRQFSAGFVNVNAATNVPIATLAGVQLQGIALFADGTIVVSDAGNHVLWQIAPLSKATTIFTGQYGAPGPTFGSTNFAKLNRPQRLAHASGDVLVAADYGNNRLAVVSRDGSINSALNSVNSQIWFGEAGDPVGPANPRFIPMTSPVGVALGSGVAFGSEVQYGDIRELFSTGLSAFSGTSSTTNIIVGGNGSTNIVITVTVAQPLVSPISGYYPMGRLITVSSTASKVYYTMDGSEPTPVSPQVNMAGNIGTIPWFNSTNDLTALSVKAYVGTNSSVSVIGQSVSSSDIGIPPAPTVNSNILAGIGSTIVVPVVVDLQTNTQVKSYQFRVEVAPINNPNPIPAGFEMLNISTNDFIQLATAAQGNSPATNGFASYTIGLTNGLEIAALGTGANVFFQHYAVVALLKVPIPYNANVGDMYSILVNNPSATSDGVNAAVPLSPMPPAIIVVTNVPYLVGDSASSGFTWYNAGGFGNGNLDNADVNNAFYAALGLHIPYSFSDAFNAMDAYPLDTGGSGVGGDGQIRFLDWQVILQRSLRLDPNNWNRIWSAGGSLMDMGPFNLSLAIKSKTIKPKSLLAAPWYRQALVGALPVGNLMPGATVDVPVYAQLAYGSTVSGMQFRAMVIPQGATPALSEPPRFIPAADVPAPTMIPASVSDGVGCGWPLGTLDFISHSSNFLGTVHFTIPPRVLAGQGYMVCFTNADGAPDFNTQYDFESRRASVTVIEPAPAASICSDDWLMYFYGSLTNPLAGDQACGSGASVPNWLAYLEGTDPLNPNSVFQIDSIQSQVIDGQSQVGIHWLTAPGKGYQVQWRSSPSGGSWNNLGTVIGDGNEANFPDANAADAGRFYRLQLLP